MIKLIKQVRCCLEKIVSVEEKKLKIFGNKKKIYVYRKNQIKTLKKVFNKKEKLKF
jgi:hypothetical protein